MSSSAIHIIPDGQTSLFFLSPNSILFSFTIGEHLGCLHLLAVGKDVALTEYWSADQSFKTGWEVCVAFKGAKFLVFYRTQVEFCISSL